MARARSKPSVDYNALVKLLKKSGDEKHSEIAKGLGIQPSQLDMMTFHRARVEAGIVDEAPATAKSVRRLRDTEQARWEEIAARTGLGVSAAKNMYEEAGGDSTAYVGRGRNWNGAEEETPKRGTTKRSSAKASSAKRGEGKKTASAKRGEGKKTAAAKRSSSKKSGAAPARARTRAERAARASGNPS